MKFSRDWLNDYVDLSDLSDDQLGVRLTEIGHAVESTEQHGDDTVFDLEITTNRVDAMSHIGMGRELAAALGRSRKDTAASAFAGATSSAPPTIRIEAPEMCSRYTALVIRNIAVKPSSPLVAKRLEEVGLRPINNIVDITNYVMIALGHPLHAFDLDRVGGQTIIVRRGKAGESMKSLDGEMRKIDADTVVIADAQRPVGLGGIIGGFESEITSATKNVLLECAWFEPSIIRRTARRLGLKTDASYRFERRVDPNDTLAVITEAARMIVESGGGTAEAPIDVVASEVKPKSIRLRTDKLYEASAGTVGIGYALDLFRRLGFDAEQVHDGLMVTVPTYRGDIFEEMDLVEEVLRFFGLNNVPAMLPRVTTGDVRREAVDVAEDAIRDTLVGCGLSEVINYSFVSRKLNSAFSDEEPVLITNSLSEIIAAMRLSLLGGLLDTVDFNRSYGTRDGALFEIGRTYHREGNDLRERRRAAMVLFGSVGKFWGDTKRDLDFFDIKGLVEQIAAKFHVPLTYSASDERWLRPNKRAVGRWRDRTIATLGILAREIVWLFDSDVAMRSASEVRRPAFKGDVLVAEIDIDALVASSNSEWTMAPVARFPGVPMILALTHGRDLEYQRIVDAIHSFDVPFLHEVGLRDRFVPAESEDIIKTTLGMWYQAFDRSLTQDEIASHHHQLATRLAAMLPVKLL